MLYKKPKSNVYNSSLCYTKKPKSNVYNSSLCYRRKKPKSNVYNSSLCSRRNQKVMFITLLYVIEETKK